MMCLPWSKRYANQEAERKVVKELGTLWVLHIPLTLSITTVGAATVNIIEADNAPNNNVKYLLLGSVVCFSSHHYFIVQNRRNLKRFLQNLQKKYIIDNACYYGHRGYDVFGDKHYHVNILHRCSFATSHLLWCAGLDKATEKLRAFNFQQNN